MKSLLKSTYSKTKLLIVLFAFSCGSLMIAQAEDTRSLFMARSMSSQISRRPDGRRKSWPTHSSRMQASLHCPAPRSAASARVIFASAWRTRSSTSKKRSIASTPGRRKICRVTVLVADRRTCSSFWASSKAAWQVGVPSN